MMRIVAMTLTGLLVVLAVIQGLVFAALPALNYWRTDIEQALSTQLAVPVKLSEVGVRLSFRGALRRGIGCGCGAIFCSDRTQAAPGDFGSMGECTGRGACDCSSGR